VGISKVIIKTRQHLAAVKANSDMLIIELMRFSNELVPASSVKVPHEKKAAARERAMAKTLVDQMTEKWDPRRYTDEYRSALMKLIDKKVASGGKELPKEGGRRAQRATNIIDLAAVLRQSLADAGKPRKAAKKPSAKRHRKAA
jgi:DNA end-binding protein Ku